MLQKESADAKSKKPLLKKSTLKRSETKAEKKPGEKSATNMPHGHPDHSAHIKRLNRVKGQIEGIERMILDRRYCPDIIAQLKAASAGLRATEAEVLKAHLRGCVKSALAGKDAFKSEEKIQEIIKMVF
jgi:CsoR family transcriptional regulator, copper-sensing transcriptional repressor